MGDFISEGGDFEIQPKVLIRGHVFTYAEKAPFVPSGKSLLGAIEYDDIRDLLRCHECGDWFQNLGRHCTSHQMTAARYKFRHGLRLSTGLVSLKTSTRMAAKWREQDANGNGPRLSKQSAEMGRVAGPKVAYEVRHAPRHESRNLINRCDAQHLFLIQMLAAELRHTPTCAEMKKVGLSATTLIKRFGSLEVVMKEAGLAPNVFNVPGQRNRTSPLPVDFPTRQILEERMPWPKDYFGIKPLEQKTSTCYGDNSSSTN